MFQYAIGKIINFGQIWWATYVIANDIPVELHFLLIGLTRKGPKESVTLSLRTVTNNRSISVLRTYQELMTFSPFNFCIKFNPSTDGRQGYVLFDPAVFGNLFLHSNRRNQRASFRDLISRGLVFHFHVETPMNVNNNKTCAIP